MGKRLTEQDIPEVTAWLSIPQTAQALGISRQQAHKLATKGYFETLSRIGSFLVVFYEEVEEKVFQRA